MLLTFLRRIGEANVKASISSVTVANTFLDFANAAHWASASQGAYITGTPSNESIFIASFFISLVIFKLRYSYLSASCISPVSKATFRFS